MNSISKRVNQLENIAGNGEYEPPVIIRWITEPNRVGDWAVAWVRGPSGGETLRRNSDETFEAFKERVGKAAGGGR